MITLQQIVLQLAVLQLTNDGDDDDDDDDDDDNDDIETSTMRNSLNTFVHVFPK